MDFVLWCRTSTVAQCQWHTGKGNLPPCYPHRLNTHIVFDICRLVCIASYNKYNYWTILYVFVWLLFLWFVSRWNRQNATRLFPPHVFRNWWANLRKIEIKYDKEVVGCFFYIQELGVEGILKFFLDFEWIQMLRKPSCAYVPWPLTYFEAKLALFFTFFSKHLLCSILYGELEMFQEQKNTLHDFSKRLKGQRFRHTFLFYFPGVSHYAVRPISAYPLERYGD